jgi:hypothetical protein
MMPMLLVALAVDGLSDDPTRAKALDVNPPHPRGSSEEIPPR